MLILKTKKLASESIVEPSYDTLKWLSVYRAYPIDMPISSARLPTAKVRARPALARWSWCTVDLRFHMVRLSVSVSSMDPSYDQLSCSLAYRNP